MSSLIIGTLKARIEKVILMPRLDLRIAHTFMFSRISTIMNQLLRFNINPVICPDCMRLMSSVVVVPAIHFTIPQTK